MPVSGPSATTSQPKQPLSLAVVPNRRRHHRPLLVDVLVEARRRALDHGTQLGVRPRVADLLRQVAQEQRNPPVRSSIAHVSGSSAVSP